MVQTDAQLLAKWAKKTKNIGEHKVVFITDKLVDCFFNSGWEEQTRIYLDKGKKSFRFTNPDHAKIGRLNYLVKQVIGELL